MPATCARDPRSAPADASEALTAFPWKERQEMGEGREAGRGNEQAELLTFPGSFPSREAMEHQFTFRWLGPSTYVVSHIGKGGRYGRSRVG